MNTTKRIFFLGHDFKSNTVFDTKKKFALTNTFIFYFIFC